MTSSILMVTETPEQAETIATYNNRGGFSERQVARLQNGNQEGRTVLCRSQSGGGQ